MVMSGRRYKNICTNSMTKFFSKAKAVYFLGSEILLLRNNKQLFVLQQLEQS